VGCQYSKDKTKESLEDKVERERQELIASIKQKYNVKYDWDDFIKTMDKVEYKYSISYKPVLETKCQIFRYYGFELKDIYEKEGVEYASITAGFFYHFKFPITREIKDKLLIADKKYIVVVSIEDIKKIDFVVSSNYDESVELKTGGFEFAGKGKIIEMIELP